MSDRSRRRAPPALRPLAATAGVTFRGFFHDRSLIAALALVLASLGFAAVLSSASVGSGERLAADIGWAAAGLFGWLLALSYGSGLADRGGVLGPVELARPVSASLLLAGRFLGLGAGLAAYAGLATLALLVWLASAYGAAAEAAVVSGWLLLLRLLVVLALAVFFSALVHPAAAATLAAAAAAAGWFSGSLPPAPPLSYLQPLSAAARLLLPDLSILEPVSSPNFAALVRPTLYAILYSAGTMAAALVLFPRLARRSRAPH